MKDLNKSIILIIVILTFVSTCFSYTSSVTLKAGRTDPNCDFNNPGKTLLMLGGTYELWYKEFISLGISPYVSQMQGGNYTAVDVAGNPANFRTYVFGTDLQARLRPTWKYLNIRLNEGPNPDVWQLYRIAPYINGGIGAILFNPEHRNGGKVPGNYDKYSFVSPVYGAGLTFFFSPGYNLDMGYEEHKVNSDYLDGQNLGKSDDWFGTYYIGLTIAAVKKPVEEVKPIVVVEEPKPMPKPEPKVEPKPEPKPEPVPEPVVEVKPEPKPEPVIVPEPPAKPEPEIMFKKDINLVIKGVQFKTNSAELTPAATVELDKVVEALKEFPEVTLEIQGHTDSDGSDAANLDLSNRRSRSVKTYLVSKGIADSRLTTKGFGESVPIATNATPAGKAQNRRIEFVRTDK